MASCVEGSRGPVMRVLPRHIDGVLHLLRGRVVFVSGVTYRCST